MHFAMQLQLQSTSGNPCTSRTMMSITLQLTLFLTVSTSLVAASASASADPRAQVHSSYASNPSYPPPPTPTKMAKLTKNKERRRSKWHPRTIIHSVFTQGSPTTPAAVLQPWEIVKEDPHPLLSIEELEQVASQSELESVVNQVVGSEPGILIQRFRPHPAWLWRQWFGTVLFHTAGNVLMNMLLAVVFCTTLQYTTYENFNIWQTIPPFPVTFPRLEAVDKIWKTLMSLATFLLTFFVGQAYSFWRAFYDQARGMQGRMNDINMLLAANGATSTFGASAKENNNDTHNQTNETGSEQETSQYNQHDHVNKDYYTDEALGVLNLVAAKLRVCHLLFWAANAPRFRVLLTQRGLNRLVEVGYLPLELKEQVIDATHGLAPAQKWTAMLLSAFMSCQKALKEGHLRPPHSNTALDRTLMDQFTRLRAHIATINDLVDGRMPLAYAHFVQILVDLFLIVAPVAQYPEMGIFSVFLVGILTLFYRGLLDLAKVFLDPLDMEDYCEGAVYLNLAVFIREANAASTRWILGGRATATSNSNADDERRTFKT